MRRDCFHELSPNGELLLQSVSVCGNAKEKGNPKCFETEIERQEVMTKPHTPLHESEI